MPAREYFRGKIVNILLNMMIDTNSVLLFLVGTRAVTIDSPPTMWEDLCNDLFPVQYTKLYTKNGFLNKPPKHHSYSPISIKS